MKIKNKRIIGFTLIELLATVIILAIIALIATPIIIDIIEDAENSANMSTAQLIVNEGHNCYAGSMLDEEKKNNIENEIDIYPLINMTNKPSQGQMYVNSKDQVAIAVVIKDKCYKKTYVGDIEVVDVSECDLGYMGPDEIAPTTSQKAINTSSNENGWYKEDIYVEIEVEDNESGPAGYRRCMGQNECEPDETIYELDSKIYINTESATNYVCVIGIDNKGNESEKNCEVYKLDKTLPSIEGIADKVVQKSELVDLNEGVIVNDLLSGIDGEIIIEPSSIDTSVTGTKEVKYSIKDKAGNVKEVIRNIVVDAKAPEITYSLIDSGSINSNGWAKENFYVRATITDNSGSGIKSAKSCSTNSSSECNPIADISGNTKDFYIEVEGSNRLCIEVIDNNNKTTKLCSDTYKLDKTAPIAGTATFTGTLGSNNWYTTNVTVNKINGSDSLSGHSNTISNVTSIANNTSEQIITITTTDLAGNSAIRNYTIKVDKNSPTLTAKSNNVDVKQGESNVVSNYFNVSYSISGGSISCNPANTNILSTGIHSVSCKAIGNNGKESTAENISVKVLGPLESITINTNNSQIDVGDTTTFTVTYNPNDTYDEKSVTWSSSDNSVATVSNGVVKGISGGQVTITATASNGKKATSTINVNHVWDVYGTTSTVVYKDVITEYNKYVQLSSNVEQIQWQSKYDRYIFDSQEGTFKTKTSDRLVVYTLDDLNRTSDNTAGTCIWLADEMNSHCDRVGMSSWCYYYSPKLYCLTRSAGYTYFYADVHEAKEERNYSQTQEKKGTVRSIDINAYPNGGAQLDSNDDVVYWYVLVK